MGTPDEARATTKVRNVRKQAIMARHVASPLLRLGVLRRAAMRDAAEHADRLTHEQAVEGMKDMVECSVADELLAIHEQIAPLDPLPCPITIAWSEKDRIFPPAIYDAVARDRLPQARFLVLPGVGHVPMIDDPAATARTITESITSS